MSIARARFVPCARIMLHSCLVLFLTGFCLAQGLEPNAQGSPQELKATTDVCAGRSEH